MKKYLSEMKRGDNFKSGTGTEYEFIGSDGYILYFAYDARNHIVKLNGNHAFDIVEPTPKTGIPTKETLAKGDKIKIYNKAINIIRHIIAVGNTGYLYKFDDENTDRFDSFSNLTNFIYHNLTPETFEFEGKKYSMDSIRERLSSLPEITE